MRYFALTAFFVPLISCQKEHSTTPMTQENRIWFEGNPWSEGHPLKEFQWSAEIRDGVVWFHLHLETANYYSEREIDDPEPTEHDSDWEAPIVWGNYHSCTISSTNWHRGGFRVCPIDEFSLDFLDGYVATIDSLPIDTSGDWDWEDLAFHTYLLGHDSVAGHKIRFERRTGTNKFDIYWEGKIALVYAGDNEYRYNFKAQIFNVSSPTPIKAEQDGAPNPLLDE